ncbi:hypothetical protein J4E83_008883 [Alternaria metachromatica]|uniref:uncharacterized protein n=1 Tax=Alternaria metachromatica TaxID=283354 RepID=UPI0020C5AD46|nr:uncharacterized protein J4E83_008883 [Alternaria metachromatica]XP_049219136.1 uncharacterized protein J4E78_008468 [Alternaria triticimaculans]XP_051299920.1 uncharacterized protein J4E86_008411 [Alternaria arbusti]KAI4707149.1 hypothetical protein J4E89_008088 [Alternaria sp. Ai002NY15]KAI4608844.1 hypothetical protein J4E83_008883 [Alternaria metachromatica]KAI4648951.1 hypothetical protein J4E78_008468 [Alternaria triticimaculans]KAI4947894.1 hypothetical protein J4E86_008411 [Alternar
MAEAVAVVSAIQATTQLVEQVFRIFKRLRDANARQKGLPEVLARHYSELKSIKAIMGMIYDEQDLKTPTVAAELVRLQDVSERLAALIKTLVPSTTSKMIQFARQLVDGSADEKKLSAIMGELVQVKAVLVLSIQVAHVGVVRTMGKQAVANAEAIQRIDESFRELVQDCKGLKIAQLLKGRRPSSGFSADDDVSRLTILDDGFVPLTLADLKALDKAGHGDGEDSEDETLVDDSEASPREVPVKTERIVINNASRGYAVQVNAPLDTDIYKHLSSLRIQDNVAEEQSVQINYGTTTKSLSILLELARLRQVSAPVIAR